MLKGFFQEDNGNFSQTRLQMFLAFLVSVFYLVYNLLNHLQMDIAVFYGLLVYSASIKLFQKFMEKGKTPE